MNGHILVAEDNDADLEFLLTAFEKLGLSEHVVVVRDGQDALDYLQRERRWASREVRNPALVILDLSMPHIDGFTVLRTIRGSSELSDIPVVIMSGSREDGDINRAYDGGANEYVVKPDEINELLVAIRNVAFSWPVSD